MDKNISIYNTGIVSVFLQFLTALLNFYVLFLLEVKLPFIRLLLWLEVFVQMIEGGFYTWLFTNFDNIKNITIVRYYDWFITTPTMLLTYILYLLYINSDENPNLTVYKAIEDESIEISVVIFLNWLMLLFGYLGESKAISFVNSTILGFIPFCIMFYIIYIRYAIKTHIGRITFYFFVIIWALYGVANLFNYKNKNIAYNGLDFFSKNFFAVFLSYLLL
tara:strand:- start:1357 stop:2016 length:660 start_codon:yes stop_codon:yes gene_type:complete